MGQWRLLLSIVLCLNVVSLLNCMATTPISDNEVKTLQQAHQCKVPSLQILCVKKIDWQKEFSGIASKNIDERVSKYSSYVEQAIYDQKRLVINKEANEYTVQDNKTTFFDISLDDFGKILTLKFRTNFPFPEKNCFFIINDTGKVLLQDQLIDIGCNLDRSILPSENVLFFRSTQNGCTMYNCNTYRKKNFNIRPIVRDLLNKRYILCEEEDNAQIQLYDWWTDTYKIINTTLNVIDYSLVSADSKLLLLYSRDCDQGKWCWQLWSISDMSLKKEGIIDKEFLYPPLFLDDNKVQIYFYPRDIYQIHDLEKDIFYDYPNEVKISQTRISTNLEENKVLQLQAPPDSALVDLIKSTDTYQYYRWDNNIIFRFDYGVVILYPETQEFHILATIPNKEQSIFDDIRYNPLQDILIVVERSLQSNWVKLRTFKLLIDPKKIAVNMVLDRVIDQTEADPKWSLQELQTFIKTKTYQEHIKQSTKQAVDDLIEYVRVKLDTLNIH